MRVWIVLLVALLGACGKVDEMPVEPGVSLALAEQRAARLSELHYRLHFAIPAEQSQPIRGEVEIRFALTDAKHPCCWTFARRPRRCRR